LQFSFQATSPETFGYTLMLKMSTLCFMFYRWCKRPIFCGNNYIQEVAYCYIEGSFCQRWIYKQIEQQNDAENEGEYKETT